MKQLYTKTILILTLNFLVFILNAQEFKVVGYFPTYRFSLVDNIQLDQLTHINISFANPDANGILSTNGVNIDPVVSKAHDANLDVFIALAGGGAVLSDWEDWITIDERSEFIHGIMDYLAEHELQGVDVDLEWGNVNNDYSGFVLELKDSISANGMEVSAALPGTYRYPEISDEALDSFDWINIMSYDLTGPWNPTSPGPHSPYYFSVQSINHWLGQGVEKNRLTLGVPFYGWDFTNQSNVVSRTFSVIVDMNTANANTDQVGKIYYNGLPTIENKTELALEDVGGIMMWELGQDSFGEYSLLNRIHETIQGNVATHDDFKISSVEAKLFPNPADDYLNIEFNKAISGNISIVSMEGRIVKRQQINQNNTCFFDISNLAQGMYVVRIITPEFSSNYLHFHNKK